MWSSDRRGFLGLAGAGALSACGFRPAYAPGGPAVGLKGDIRVADPYDKNGFDLVERLEERLGPPRSPRFVLTYGIGIQSVGVAVTPDLSITRYNLNGTVTWQLVPVGGGAAVASGEARNFTSFSATGTTVASVTTAQVDATRRLMRILADAIVTELVATSGRWNAR